MPQKKKQYHKIQTCKRKEKDNKSFLWLWVVLFVLLILSGGIYLFFHSFKFSSLKTKSETIKTVEAKPDIDISQILDQKKLFPNGEMPRLTPEMREKLKEQNGIRDPYFQKFPKKHSNRHRGNNTKTGGKQHPDNSSHSLKPSLTSSQTEKKSSNVSSYFPIDEDLKKATLKTESQVYGGFPVAKNGEKVTVLKNIAYTSGYSEKYRNPLWVAYRYDKKSGKNNHKRPARFMVDKRTKSKVKPTAYNRTDYDKGHMAPNSGIAFRYGAKAQEETFLMSNIVPQKPLLNRKIWSRLEAYESDIANLYENVWVITGPIFGQNPKKIKDNVAVPDAFYKVFVDEDKGKIRTLSFIIPQNVTGKEPFEFFLTSIDKIEEKTGLDFFAPMNDIQESNMEKIVSRNLWK